MKRILIVVLLVVVPGVMCTGDNLYFRDDFNTIDNWKPLTFPKIEKHSRYSITSIDGGQVLKLESNNSASGLVFKKRFNVYTFPVIRWKWQVRNVYSRGNAKVKDGDDYPVRVYVIFKYNPEKASGLDKLKYNTAKLFYGEYPPHSSISYIWASRKHSRRYIESPYTSRAIMIPLQQGSTNAGKWMVESINVIKDYRQAFGESPPAQASLAVMNDSDNTGESSVSYIDFIEILRN